MPKIVIDMDEETYRSIVDKYDTFPAEWKRWGLGAIKNGTLLSKVFEDIREKVKFEIGGFEDSVDIAYGLQEALDIIDRQME